MIRNEFKSLVPKGNLLGTMQWIRERHLAGNSRKPNAFIFLRPLRESAGW